jgi:flavin reductase (DIM6/NTAB) family NADH-FMN oxidoreductase RutF
MGKMDVEVKLAQRLFAPRLVVLATSVDKNGKPDIIALSWVMPTSFDPPIVAISVGSSRYSHGLITGCGEFVVNIPPISILGKVQLCGSISGRTADKFAEAGLTSIASKKVRPPRIKECVAHLECKLVDKFQTGDHTIFVGRVVAASVDEAAFDDKENIIKLELFKPVFHLGGDYFSTSTEANLAD